MINLKSNHTTATWKRVEETGSNQNKLKLLNDLRAVMAVRSPKELNKIMYSGQKVLPTP